MSFLQSLKARSYWNRKNFADVDEIAEALHVIEHGHAKLHQGGLFVTGVTDLTLADNDSLFMFVDVPAATEVYVAFSGAAVGNSEARLYEDANFSVNSPDTRLLTMNPNRASSRTPTTGFYAEAEITATGSPITGTLIFGPRLIFGGEKNQAFGVDIDATQEFVLAASTKYAVELLNVSGGAELAQLVATFWEREL